LEFSNKIDVLRRHSILKRTLQITIIFLKEQIKNCTGFIFYFIAKQQFPYYLIQNYTPPFFSDMVNIFFLSIGYNPEECASYYALKHLGKIMLEITQMAYTAHHIYGVGDWRCGVDAPPYPLKVTSGPSGYKATHIKHPMCCWVRENASNYLWALRLARELSIRFESHYNKVHACVKHIDWLENHIPEGMKTTSTSSKMSVPPQCMPDVFRSKEETFDNVVEAYRRYYANDKCYIFRQEEDKPQWMLDSKYTNIGLSEERKKSIAKSENKKITQKRKSAQDAQPHQRENEKNSENKSNSIILPSVEPQSKRRKVKSSKYFKSHTTSPQKNCTMLEKIKRSTKA